MPTRRGPGPEPIAWRPRKIQQEWEALALGAGLKPSVIAGTMRVLPEWEDFLRRRAVDSDAATIHDLLAWEDELIASPKGFNRTAQWKMSCVRSFYLHKGSRSPDSKWSKFASEVKSHRMPRKIGKKNAYLAYDLPLLPEILEASRLVKQYSPGCVTREVYSEVPAVVATFLYGAGRAQWYGLTLDQAEHGIHEGVTELFVKEGEWVFVPIHDKLRAIWKEHLDHRDFDRKDPDTGERMFFRHGRSPYKYQSGNKDWRSDARAASSNDWHVQRVFHPIGQKEVARNADCVQRRLREQTDLDVVLQAHRFRKSVSTYMELYGFVGAERRLQLSHGAKTITDDYSTPQVLELQRKLSLMDLGNAEWVSAHSPPRNLFSDNGNGAVDAAVLEELRALRANAELQAKDLRELREELRKERERTRDLTDQLLRGRPEPRVIA